MRRGRRKACTTESMTAPKSTKSTGGQDPSFDGKAEDRPRSGRVLGIEHDHYQDAQANRPGAIKSLVTWDSAPNPPTGVRWSRANPDATITVTTCPPIIRRGVDTQAVRHHEHGEGTGCDRDNDGCPDHDVHDQHDSQQGQRALAAVVPPVSANLAVDQRLFVRRVPHRSPYL